MRMTRGFLALALTIALAAPCLALPATALGQSAGDEQYVDPFQGGGGNNDNSQSDNSDGQAQDQGTTTTTTTESGDTAGAAESDSGTLPRTGLPLAGLVLSGAALLGGGAALRRRA
jgi:hypothetical protein